MNILLTGASGFTGSRILRQLLARGLRPRCLVRPSTRLSLLPAGIELAYGDIGDVESMSRALVNIDTVINTASLGFGHAPALIESLERAEIARTVFISTTAIFTSLNTASKAVRVAAEERIANSTLRYTILRPTMIYGSSRDRNICRLIRYLRSWRVIPIAGSGTGKQQPIYVDDLAAAVLQVLEKPQRKAYNIAGATELTFNEMIDTVGRMIGRRVWRVHVPVAPAVAALRLIERGGISMPVRSEQLLRLGEDKSFDYSDAVRDFGYSPCTFEEGLRLELQEIDAARS